MGTIMSWAIACMDNQKKPVILNRIKELGIWWGTQWEMKRNIRMDGHAGTS